MNIVSVSKFKFVIKFFVASLQRVMQRGECDSVTANMITTTKRQKVPLNVYFSKQIK